MPCMEETKLLAILRGTTLLDVRIHPLICVGSTHISVTGEPVQAYLQRNCFKPTAQGRVMTCLSLLPFTVRQLSVKTSTGFVSLHSI